MQKKIKVLITMACPQYACGTLSKKWLEIQTWVQWNTHRKWHLGY